MRTSHISAALGALAVCASAYSPLTDVDTRSLDEIYAEARKEDGILQVFWGGDAAAQGDAIKTGWAQRFPDVKMNLTVELSKYLDNRIDRGHLQGIHTADVVVVQTLQDFRRWKAEGKLLRYKPATFEDILYAEKDPDGYFMAQAIMSFGAFIYDETKINASEIPTSYASMPDKKWKGKLILTYPNDDDAVAYQFSLMVNRYGFQWLYDLAQNDVQWVRGTGTPVLTMGTRHNDTSFGRVLSFTSYDSGASFIGAKNPEAPEQYLTWAQSGAILADTPMPESAKLFMSYLTSVERQNATAATGTASILNSVNAMYGLTPDSNATQLSSFRLWEQDRNTVEWWKNLFEEVLGTAQGPGPMVMYPDNAPLVG